jgi:hypothetical protein
MPDHSPSRVRIISHEPLNQHEVRITLEVIVDVHRLAEVGQEFISQAVKQMSASPD